MEPARVPIIRPSSGVRPMHVATERPPSTAVTEQPLPRWATTRRSSAAGRAKQGGGALGRPRHAHAVEAVATDAPLAVPAFPGTG